MQRNFFLTETDMRLQINEAQSCAQCLLMIGMKQS